jgi:hypothetical protein
MPFNLEAFKAASVTAAFDTTFTPTPPGVYKAEIVDFNVTPQQGSREDNKDTTYYFMEVKWKLEDPQGAIKKVTGLDVNNATQKFSLDLTPEGKIDGAKGKNTKLGALREALKQNDATKPWAPQMLVGAKATVGTFIDKFNNKTGGDVQRAMVSSVAPYNAPNGAASTASAMPSRPAGR